MRDVVVAGGGPVGCAFALALVGSDLEVELVDARAPGDAPRSDRTLALSHGARLILGRLGVWSRLAREPGSVTGIRAVDVSQRNGFGSVRLDAGEQGLPALGYVVGYAALQAALDRAIDDARVPMRRGSRVRTIATTPAYASVEVEGAHEPLVARVAVVADGEGSGIPVRRVRHDYRQSALVGFVRAAVAHAGVAYERFTPDGPVALLPWRDEHALVWTVPTARAPGLLALDPDAFLAALQRHFGDRVEGFVAVRERRAFPLALQFATEVVSQRAVLIGNAAQSLHPIAGQGFNVGLRDAFELARTLLEADRDAIGSRELLANYARGRRLDRYAGIGFTHALSALFASRSSALSVPRGAALALLDALPPAKRAFTRAMLFGLR